MRDVVYFHGRGSTRALIVLALYAVLGAAVALLAYRARVRLESATSTTGHTPATFSSHSARSGE